MGRTALTVVFLVSSFACTAWTLFAGKDVNWDLLNYHYYLPFQWVTGRLGQDFFAASAQSYLNPLGYLPFYLMVSAGWHSVVVSIVLAAAHGVGIGLLFVIAWRLFAHRPGGERMFLSAIATALGTATAILWATVGSSSLDPLLLPPMLGGLLLLQRGDGSTFWRAAAAGGLFGAAAALKYSNAIFVLAALPLAFALPGVCGAARLRACAGFIAGAAVAVGVLAGFWFVLLYREFGNPVFPLLNAWFQSPDAPAHSLLSDRFRPQDLAAALTFAFRMVTLDRSVYVEVLAPDLRFAAVLGLTGALLLPNPSRMTGNADALSGADWRVLVFVFAGSVLWLASSGNGRYGMILLLLVGVAVARLADRLLPGAAARVMLVVLLVLQLALIAIASPARWFVVEPWSRQWLPYAAPERVLREPALYLSLETLPMAVVAPFVHPDSSFVNLRGQISIPSDSPRLAKLLQRHRGRVRVLGRELVPLEGAAGFAHRIAMYDAILRRVGFRIDAGDCTLIAWRPDQKDRLSRLANRIARVVPSSEPLSVGSCAVRAVGTDPEELDAARRISALFDRIERTCDRLFRGHTSVTERLGQGWSRHYNNLDARLEAIGGRVVLNRYRTGEWIALGTLSGWEGEPPGIPATCRRK